MYKILFDTNTLLDFLISEREENHAAQRIMKLAAEEKLEGCVSPISLLNIFYILRKQRTEQERKEIIESFLDILTLVELDIDTMRLGIYVSIDDYEDGIQYLSAKKVNADFIITRDRQFRDYDLDIQRISSIEFIEQVCSDTNILS